MKRFSSFLCATLAVLCLLVNTLPAGAATTGGESGGLSITPRKDAVAKPGQTISDKLVVGNLSSDQSLNIGIRVVDFTFLNDTGTPKLDLAANAPTTTWSLKPFLNVPATAVIPASHTKEIPYSITIPKSQGAGSYYSAIEYSTSPSNGGGNVGLGAAGVTLLFVSVPGVVKENMTVQKLGAFLSANTPEGGTYQYIATSKPQDRIGYTLQNNGNVTESPTGTITVKHWFGGKKYTLSNVNVNSELALIGQTRLFTTCIAPQKQAVNFQNESTVAHVCAPSHLAPGHYSVSLDVFYGQNGNPTQEVTAKAGFWYLPLWFVLVVLAVIVAVAYSIRRFYRKLTGASGGSSWRSSRRLSGS